MKLFLESDDGTKVEVKEIETIAPTSDVLIMLTASTMPPNLMKIISESVREKLGKKLVILPPHITKVIGVPGVTL